MRWLRRRDPVGFELSRIPLPDLGAKPGGFGSALVPVGSTSRIVLSLPSGRAQVPWACLDVNSDDVVVGRALPGEVRDGAIGDDGRGWLLTTTGLARVDVSGRPEVLEFVAPRGLGADQARMLWLGGSRWGVCRWSGRTLTVVDVESGQVIRRIEVPAPHAARLGADRVTLYAPHGGERLVLRAEDLRRLEAAPMPTGTAPLFDADEVVLLVGRRQPIPNTTRWTVAPTDLGVFDATTFTRRALVAAPRGARDVLGVDAANRLVLSTDDGLALVGRETLREAARLRLRDVARPGGHLLLPRAQAVVMTDGIWPDEVIVVRW